VICLLALWTASILTGTPTCFGAPNEPFRMAFSASMFSEVKEEDVRAAMKVWIMTVARDRGIVVDANPNIMQNIEEMEKYGLANRVDGFGITTVEYPRLSRTMKFDMFTVGMKDGRYTEEYLLLVKNNSGLENIEALIGRTLNVLNNPRMSLALIWLDTVLVKATQKSSQTFFGQVNRVNKPMQTLLPVFFGKIDACLITRQSFETMEELNPQIGKQLRVLAASPEYVPSGFAFRAEHQTEFRPQIIEAMKQLHESPAGRQILTLTQASRLEPLPIACLDRSLELLQEHQRLLHSRTIEKTVTPRAGVKPLREGRNDR
jgi:phosphonate transport system substrate-binding protein